MPYTQPPVSPFQRYLRDPAGGISNSNANPDSNSNSNPSVVLRDHVCKGLTPLNMERTRLVPRNQPGADWRAFLEVVLRDPGRAVFQVGCGTRCEESVEGMNGRGECPRTSQGLTGGRPWKWC